VVDRELFKKLREIGLGLTERSGERKVRSIVSEVRLEQS
jgi:hypothetical protein